MSELRQDPITLAWVVVAAERAKRPRDLSPQASESVPRAEDCPFCEGNEKMTPPEVLAFREPGSHPDGPGWRLRVFPNLYPAFGPPEGDLATRAVGPYTCMSGLGLHEVVVHSPLHNQDLGLAPLEAVDRLVQAYTDRYLAHERYSTIAYTLIASNHGRAAGASLEHSHSQIFGVPIVPPSVHAELQGTARYTAENRSCPYCDIITYEMLSGERVVYDNEDFVVLAPYASQVPYECWVLPKAHSPRFERLSPKARRSFAAALRSTLGKLRHGLDNPPYCFFIHTTPHQGWGNGLFHWHLELWPKLSIAAGFELGTGMMINTQEPEAAAELLRGVEPNLAG